MHSWRIVLVAALVGVVLSTPAGAVGRPDDRARDSCISTGAYVRPVAARLSGLDATYDVVPVKRRPDGSIGSPPLSRKGKQLLGWDPFTRPGEGSGSVIFDAHTWPDGSALGNALLEKMHPGQTIAVQGGDGQQVCYEITDRRSYPAGRVPRKKLFRHWGSEQLVVVVCSGKRLGPGAWSRRTIWRARPMAPR